MAGPLQQRVQRLGLGGATGAQRRIGRKSNESGARARAPGHAEGAGCPLDGLRSYRRCLSVGSWQLDANPISEFPGPRPHAFLSSRPDHLRPCPASWPTNYCPMKSTGCGRALSGQGLRLAAEGAAGRAERELAERRRLSDLLQVTADAADCAATPQAAVQMVLDEICAHTGWPVGHAYLASADAPPVLVSAGLGISTRRNGSAACGRAWRFRASRRRKACRAGAGDGRMRLGAGPGPG